MLQYVTNYSVVKSGCKQAPCGCLVGLMISHGTVNFESHMGYTLCAKLRQLGSLMLPVYDAASDMSMLFLWNPVHSADAVCVMHVCIYC